MLAFRCAALADMSNWNGVEVGAAGSVAIIFRICAIKSAGSSVVEHEIVINCKVR